MGFYLSLNETFVSVEPSYEFGAQVNVELYKCFTLMVGTDKLLIELLKARVEYCELGIAVGQLLPVVAQSAVLPQNVEKENYAGEDEYCYENKHQRESAIGRFDVVLISANDGGQFLRNFNNSQPAILELCVVQRDTDVVVGPIDLLATPLLH